MEDTLIQKNEEVVGKVVVDVSEGLNTVDNEDNYMLEQEEVAGEINTMQDQLAEAEAAQEVLCKMDEAKTPEEAVCIAKSHLLDSIGYQPGVSIESFSSSDEGFNTALTNAINVAQESIFASIGDAIKLSVTSDAKIADQVSKAATAITTNGSNEKTLKSASWASVFAESGKAELTAEDVISTVKKYKAITAGTNFNTLTSKVADMLSKISAQTDRNWFIATAGSADEVKKLTDIADKMQRDIGRLVIATPKGKASKSVSLAALTPAQAGKLSKEVQDLLKHENLEKISKTLKEEVKSGANMYNIVSSFRYNKETPEDVKAAKKSIDAFRAVLQSVKDFLLFKSKVCYSSLQYIKASTK